MLKGFNLNVFFSPSKKECFGITSSLRLQHENHNQNNPGQLTVDVNEANQTP